MNGSKRLFSVTALSFLLVGTLILLSSSSVQAYEPEIHLVLSQEEAETYEEVVVVVYSDPIPIGENQTKASNHTIQLTFTNLGSGEAIYEEEIVLYAGVATWEFDVDPNWGEFTGVVKVVDEELDSQATASVEISYSSDYLINIMAQLIADLVQERMEPVPDYVQRIEMMSIGLFITVTVLVPLVLLRQQHINARKNNEDSFWDRFINRFLRYSETTSKFSMYMVSLDYRHPRSAKVYFEADNLLQRWYDAKEDEEFILYEKSMIKQRLEKIDPELVKDL